MIKRRYQVAIILVNYNSSNYTLGCVQSIFKQTASTIRFQVIVVDNNSRADEFERLSELRGQSNLLVIRSNINLGFSGANMLGVQSAEADHYYFLNNDCVLLNDCLSVFLEFMDANPMAANCSGEMFIANGEYDCNFGYFPSLALKLLGSGLLRFFSPQRFPDRHKRFNVPTPVDLVNGSSMFMRAYPFENIGGFDTQYFLYCEEEDIALRLRRAGHLTYVVPAAKYQHFVSKSTQSSGGINLVFLKEFYISFLYYFGKNYGMGYRLLMQCFSFIRMGLKFHKDLDYFRLALFIAKGAPPSQSLRFAQKQGPVVK